MKKILPFSLLHKWPLLESKMFIVEFHKFQILKNIKKNIYWVIFKPKQEHCEQLTRLHYHPNRVSSAKLLRAKGKLSNFTRHLLDPKLASRKISNVSWGQNNSLLNLIFRQQEHEQTTQVYSKASSSMQQLAL